MPVEMKMRISKTLMTDYRKNCTFKVQKFVWDHTYAQTYYEMLLSEEVTLIFEQATELINAALEKFNDGINRAGECMKKTITLGENKKTICGLIPNVGRSATSPEKIYQK